MDSKYLTVKEFAEQANISQQAVYKQINGRLKPFMYNINGQKVIEAAALEKFYSTQGVQPTNPDTTAQNLDFQPKVVQSQTTENQPETRNQKEKELERKIEQLQEQLKKIIENEQEEKLFLRDQIKEKDRQIEHLTENLKMAQQLAAADKKKLIELEEKQAEKSETIITAAVNHEADQPEHEAPQGEKKSFFARFFGL